MAVCPGRTDRLRALLAAQIYTRTGAWKPPSDSVAFISGPSAMAGCSSPALPVSALYRTEAADEAGTLAFEFKLEVAPLGKTASSVRLDFEGGPDRPGFWIFCDAIQAATTRGSRKWRRFLTGPPQRGECMG